MKPRHLVAIAIAASTLGISSLSFAQGNSHGHGQRFDAPSMHRVDDRRDDRRDFRAERRDDRRDFRQERREDRRDYRHDRRADRHEYRHGPQVRHYQARGPQFQRGRYIPSEYRSRQYVVVNHQQHRLYAPPRGQQWVQVGSDYVLVAIATGLIINLMLSN
ncbi:MAG: RcnB family protein [Hydrogenophaga sp.]|uniref:RcnB family protein n=1 Tax=Hydrogenophaga sp. TaxID=1904254 RepID=UPI002634F6C8|nr:RcnB family protein [Hydrogenophaga sp.]MDM7941934.1 RcnB family protein [Hydrogenophaga sp.]